MSPLRGGYGRFRIGQKDHRAHRVSAEMCGHNMDGKSTLHSCDNPKCVNPWHLRPGTDKDNARDSVERGRCKARENIAKWHVGSGYKLTPSQAAEIRTLGALGECSTAIAARYGISKKHAERICTGKRWKVA